MPSEPDAFPPVHPQTPWRWEDQEIKIGTSSAEFPKETIALFCLCSYAQKCREEFVHIDQPILDGLIASQQLPKEAKGARIDRLCLFFRLRCRLGPGGDGEASLGAFPFWSNDDNCYAITYISPLNNWLDLTVLKGPRHIRRHPSGEPMDRQ
jgi:hypothetical protein